MIAQIIQHLTEQMHENPTWKHTEVHISTDYPFRMRQEAKRVWTNDVERIGLILNVEEVEDGIILRAYRSIV